MAVHLHSTRFEGEWAVLENEVKAAAFQSTVGTTALDVGAMDL